MTLYKAVLIVKLLSVLTYSGGLVAAFVAGEHTARSQAAHQIASTGMLLTWASGLFLVWLSGLRLFELWIVAAFVLSLISQLALVHSVATHQRTASAFIRSVIPLTAVIVLMVTRPTWSSLSQ
jgi:hypothetical protein